MQQVKVFDHVLVKIEVNMERVDYSLIAINPFKPVYLKEQEKIDDADKVCIGLMDIAD